MLKPKFLSRNNPNSIFVFWFLYVITRFQTSLYLKNWRNVIHIFLLEIKQIFPFVSGLELINLTLNIQTPLDFMNLFIYDYITGWV